MPKKIRKGVRLVWDLATIKNFFFATVYYYLYIIIIIIIIIITIIIVNDIWNKSYTYCGNEMKMKKWSKTSGLQRGLNPWPRDTGAMFYQWAMKLWGFFTKLHKLRSLRQSFLHFHFISAVHIWFISYIINTHFFHGNIWIHNWRQWLYSSVGRTSHWYREVTGLNPVEVLIFFQAALYAIA